MKKKILCVEDHRDMCELVTRILAEYEVCAAHSKVAALKLAMEQQFDLYLLDYYLPDGTGLDLCLLLRTFDKHTPIFFITADRSVGEMQVTTAGAHGLLKKGAEFADLLQATVAQTFLAERQ